MGKRCLLVGIAQFADVAFAFISISCHVLLTTFLIAYVSDVRRDHANIRETRCADGNVCAAIGMAGLMYMPIALVAIFVTSLTLRSPKQREKTKLDMIMALLAGLILFYMVFDPLSSDATSNTEPDEEGWNSSHTLSVDLAPGPAQELTFKGKLYSLKLPVYVRSGVMALAFWLIVRQSVIAMARIVHFVSSKCSDEGYVGDGE